MLTAEALAELRRLLADGTPGPWHLDAGGDRGVYTDPRPTIDSLDIANAYYRADEVLIAAAVNALPALLDAAAERDALADAVARVRALHYAADNDAARTPICETCHGKAGVHECGCWADRDREPVCGHCMDGWHGASVPWPCPTIRALDSDGLDPEPACLIHDVSGEDVSGWEMAECTCPAIHALDGEADR